MKQQEHWSLKIQLEHILKGHNMVVILATHTHIYIYII